MTIEATQPQMLLHDKPPRVKRAVLSARFDTPMQTSVDEQGLQRFDIERAWSIVNRWTPEKRKGIYILDSPREVMYYSKHEDL